MFYWWKVSKFLLVALFANARRVNVSKFRVENTAILGKLIFLLFSKTKAFCENNLHQITYLPKSYLWTKNEGNRFFNSCHSMVDISWPSLLILLNSITLKSNLIVSGIQWLIKCPFCREPVLHPFSGLFISKSGLSPQIKLIINETKNTSANEWRFDEGCEKSPSAVILDFFSGTSSLGNKIHALKL